MKWKTMYLTAVICATFLYGLRSAAQPVVVACSDFDNGLSQGWTFERVDHTVSIGGPSGSTNYLRCSDQTVTGVSRIIAPAVFHGDWRKCATFCYDFRLINDGGTGGCTPYFILKGGGHAALFTWNSTVSTSSGWMHICAPIHTIGSTDALPSGWTMSGGAPNSAWNDLLASVDEIAFTIDLAGASGTEVMGFDNICLQNNCACTATLTSAPLPPAPTQNCSCRFSLRLRSPEKVDKIVLTSSDGSIAFGCPDLSGLPGTWSIDDGGLRDPKTITFRAPAGMELPCCESGALIFGVSKGGTLVCETFNEGRSVCTSQFMIKCNPCTCSFTYTKLPATDSCACRYRIDITDPVSVNAIRLNPETPGVTITGVTLLGSASSWNVQTQGDNILISGASNPPCEKISLEICLSGSTILKVSNNEGRACVDSTYLVCDTCTCELAAVKQQSPKCSCMYAITSKNPRPVDRIIISTTSGAAITEGASSQLLSLGWIRSPLGASQLTFYTPSQNNTVQACDAINFWLCVDQSAWFTVSTYRGRNLVCIDSLWLDCAGSPQPCGKTKFSKEDDCFYNVSHLNTNPLGISIDDFHVWVQGSSTPVQLEVLGLPAGWSRTNEDPSRIDIRADGPAAAVPHGQLFSGLRFRILPSCVGVKVGWMSTAHGIDSVVCSGSDSLECKGDCIPIPSPDNLLGWWPFDETAGPVAHDIGTGNHGNWSSGVQSTSGMVDRSAYLRDVLKCWDITVPHSPSLDFYLRGFSFDAWVRLDVSPMLNSDRAILSKMSWNGTNPQQGYILAVTPSGKLRLTLASAGVSEVVTQASSGSLTDGHWHHIAVTVDRGNAHVTMFIDGAEVWEVGMTQVMPDAPVDAAADLIFGNAYMHNCLYGRLDELEIFTDVLTPQEVYDLWHAGSCGKCKPSVVSTICGLKYEDVNRNGTHDPAEPWLPGWSMVLTDQDGNPVSTAITNEDGLFCFEGLDAGTYVVTEVQQPGWTQTQPGSPQSYSVLLPAGVQHNGSVFGNARQYDCYDVIDDPGNSDPLACTQSFTVHNPWGSSKPINTINLVIEGGVLNDLTLSTSCPYTLNPSSYVGASVVAMHFTPSCPLNIPGAVSIFPTNPDGMVTLYWTIVYDSTVCYDTTSMWCCSAPCDTVLSWPIEDWETSNDSRTFQIINRTASPIAWVEWTLDPPLTAGAGCSGSLDGGDAFVDGAAISSAQFQFPFLKIPSTGILSPLAQNTVQFNLGMDWFCAWSGVVHFVVHHADSSICHVTSDTWTVKAPVTLRFITDDGLPWDWMDIVHKIVAENRLNTDVHYISVSITEPVSPHAEITAITAGPVPRGESSRYLAKLKMAQHNTRQAMFQLKDALKPGDKTGLIHILVAIESGYSAKSTLRLTAYDKSGSILMVDLDTSTTEVKTFNGTTLPDDFELLDCFPNPAQGFTTVNYALGKAMNIRLSLYDISGRHIRTLYEGRRESGLHSNRFDSASLPSGSYLIRLDADGRSVTMPASVVK